MQTFICDACQAVTPEPIAVEWEYDGDDETVWTEEAHLCSWQCLASWAMSRHLETADQ